MKKKLKWLLPVTLFTIIAACNSNSTNNSSSATDSSNTGKADSANTDAKQAAKDSNMAKFDTSGMKKDAEFVVNAADGGMYEVQAGQLAVKNGSSQQVKTMGQKMIDDHSKANDELKALAAKYNISIPSGLGDKCQKKYDKLAKLTGKDFDKEYTDKMISDHKDDIDDFQKETDKGNNAEIKQWAAKTLPTLQGHLQMWKDTKDKSKS